MRLSLRAAKEARNFVRLTVLSLRAHVEVPPVTANFRSVWGSFMTDVIVAVMSLPARAHGWKQKPRCHRCYRLCEFVLKAYRLKFL